MEHFPTNTSFHKNRRFRFSRLVVTSILALVLSGCANIRALEPAGPPAQLITNLWWFMFWTSLVIFLAVVGLLIYALFKPRQPTDDHSIRTGRAFITWGGVIIPAIVILAVMSFTLYGMDELASPPSNPVIEIHVTSNMWWWDVRYPEYGIATGNEIHIPAGQPVNLQLRAVDVIHSFWVPQLQGKRDMMPHTTTQLWLLADQPGEYRGQCAEFCGLQHANMAFLVIAHTPEEFQEWLELRSTPPPPPTDPYIRRGQQVFLGAECVYCHTIRGTVASGTVGPDLTDIASRRELGAGTLPNTPGHLASWTINAQLFKPGNRMPPMPMQGEDFNAMMAYMRTLR
jgi:cytochrome c oxidase subunit II